MARIRGKNTGPEQRVAELLRTLGLPFESHCRDLPGCPDFVLRGRKLAVFVDGDFWHGWRFSVWRHKLTGRWEDKIAENRRRDRRNHERLRRLGWRVLRLWEHQVKASPERCVSRLVIALGFEKARRQRKRKSGLSV
jgi:DNA mismatch endonuclease (patch repair protein)